MEEMLMPVVYSIGHDSSRRSHPVSEEEFHVAQRLGYNTLTSPITRGNDSEEIFQLLAETHLETGKGRVEDPPLKIKLPPLDPADTGLGPSSHVARLIFKTNPTIDLMCPDRQIADLSRQVLMREVSYAAWCGASSIMIQGPHPSAAYFDSDRVAQFARAVLDALGAGAGFNIQVLLPMSFGQDTDSTTEVGDLGGFSEKILPPDNVRTDSEEAGPWSSWEVWNVIRTVCRYSSRLSVALMIPKQLPSRAVQARWFSEPMRILNIPRTTFVPNKHGYDVLSRPHQELLSVYMGTKNPPWILLSDIGHLPTVLLPEPPSTNGVISGEPTQVINAGSTAPNPAPAESSSNDQTRARCTTLHLEYLRTHIQRKHAPLSEEDRYANSYQDFLQDPLQPLTDNLESSTYEVFEKDRVKYDSYERAITAALTDWPTLEKPTSDENGTIVIAVVGAGRGPLVECARRAAITSGQSVEIWAVEKNPSAYLHLQRRNMAEWEGQVHVVKSDMRHWGGPTRLAGRDDESWDSSVPSTPATFRGRSNQATYKVDILVSELLGSFGDNELSPECLDGAQHLLHNQGAISIPSSYSAFVTPVAAPKLYADNLLRTRNRLSPRDPFQVPYVVWLHSCDYLSSQPLKSTQRRAEERAPTVKRAWGFHHPREQHLKSTNNEHNERFAVLSFDCEHRGVCHGIGGYFEAMLYETPVAAGDIPDNDGEDQASVITGDEPADTQMKGVAGLNDGDVVLPKFELSTNPLTISAKSPNMTSWFSMFFPLKNPVSFPDDSILHLTIWRKTDGRCVWYEWMVEAFVKMSRDKSVTKIRICTSELHSSIDTACQM